MNGKWLTGNFLVASRYLRDPNFVRSVVLMIHHDEQGDVGVIINRPADRTVREVWQLKGFDPCDVDDHIYLGGPVEGPLVAVHSQEVFSEREILPDLYFSMHRDAVDLIVRKRDQPFRLYSGHAGWGSGQLEGELAAGGWLYTRANKDDVFADHTTVWKAVTQRIGLEIMAPDLSADLVPPDPSLN